MSHIVLGMLQNCKNATHISDIFLFMGAGPSCFHHFRNFFEVVFCVAVKTVFFVMFADSSIQMGPLFTANFAKIAKL